MEEDDAGTDPKDPDSIPEALQDTGPNDDLPNAGDNTNIVVPLSLALISGLLILLIILKEKKEDKETILN
ncbi:MAG: LPXTG cell wall anchor domain-containing protein [Erysipelotrichia bacterium]|nr:LPXTG cell wall anchor domain-containing protein [Erysipelotrichia bacterium]